MKRILSHRAVGHALLTLGLATLAAPLVAQSEVTSYTPSRIQWETLSFRASRMGVRAESEVRLRLAPASSFQAELIQPAEGEPIAFGGDQVAEIIIESTVRGRTSVMDLLLDPQSAAAYQRTLNAERKRESVYRTFRFMKDGVFIRRQTGPASGGGEPTGWPVSFERTLPYAEGLSGASITEAAALFYMLSAGDFTQVGDTLTFYNFDRDGMSRVTLKVEEITQFDVDYTEVSPSGERRVRATHPVARLTVSGTSVGKGEEAFSFLGLTGNIEIFADPQLRIPVAVRGRVPRAGNTTVRLNRMTVR